MTTDNIAASMDREVGHLSEEEFLADIKETDWPWEAEWYGAPDPKDCFAGGLFAHRWALLWIEQHKHLSPDELVALHHRDWDAILRQFYRACRAQLA